jgi:1-aminocyclopropane-1-carboxylate deaminase/D-cysteine desulfhydrase-like pyridoxal-dependent ACC family enzyme
VTVPDSMPALTPVERWGPPDDCIWVKRDDAYVFAGQAGGKVRTCLALAGDEFGDRPAGLVTASARSSPQQLIVASIAERLHLPCRLHVPASREPSETLDASVTKGARVVEHRPGYNSVLVARARADADALGWTYIPFGMECAEAVRQTSRQVINLPDTANRIVIPVGSGMSLAGVLWGLERMGADDVPVLGVVVGADPTRRLDRYAPAFWRQMIELVPSGLDYHQPYNAGLTAYEEGQPRTLELDPWYEAKCLPFLEPGDLLWVVGTRYPERSPVALR